MEKIAAETCRPPVSRPNGPGSLISKGRRKHVGLGVRHGRIVLFIFLVLAAQFESLILPLSIILIIPMCLLAAMIGVHVRGMDNNVLTQIGLVVLIALAAKNAILIVEFARQDEAGAGIEHGRGRGPRCPRPPCGRS